jgi:hypothetical protein
MYMFNRAGLAAPRNQLLSWWNQLFWTSSPLPRCPWQEGWTPRPCNSCSSPGRTIELHHLCMGRFMCGTFWGLGRYVDETFSGVAFYGATRLPVLRALNRARCRRCVRCRSFLVSHWIISIRRPIGGYITLSAYTYHTSPPLKPSAQISCTRPAHPNSLWGNRPGRSDPSRPRKTANIACQFSTL